MVIAFAAKVDDLGAFFLRVTNRTTLQAPCRAEER